jgi:hypothetical protein
MAHCRRPGIVARTSGNNTRCPNTSSRLNLLEHSKLHPIYDPPAYTFTPPVHSIPSSVYLVTLRVHAGGPSSARSATPQAQNTHGCAVESSTSMSIGIILTRPSCERATAALKLEAPRPAATPYGVDDASDPIQGVEMHKAAGYRDEHLVWGCLGVISARIWVRFSCRERSRGVDHRHQVTSVVGMYKAACQREEHLVWGCLRVISGGRSAGFSCQGSCPTVQFIGAIDPDRRRTPASEILASARIEPILSIEQDCFVNPIPVREVEAPQMDGTAATLG